MPESYASCLWLEGGLVFQNRYLSVCCTNHSDGKKGHPFICRFDGGELPLDKIFTVRDELRRNVRDGVDCACTGCPALTHLEWPEEKKEFRQIAIANFSHCNLECYYCENHSPPEKENGAVRAAYDILPIVSSLHDKGLIEPNFMVQWGGGEPTLVAEFEPLLRFLMDRQAPIEINTNATVLSPAILDGLSSGRIKNIICSVDAGKAETFSAIKKRDMFDRVWRNLHTYAKANRQAVIAKFIMLEQNSNIEEITAFIAQCRMAEIGRIRLSRDTQTPTTKHILEMSATLILLAVKEGMELDFPPVVFGKANCMWMMHYVHQLVGKEKDAVDYSRLWKLNHMVFNYLKLRYPINT